MPKGRGIDLETFKEILNPDNLYGRYATVQNISVPADRSKLYVDVLVLPEEFPMIAEMTWDMVGPDAGIFQFPSVNDLVIVDFLEDDEDQCVVVRRCTSSEDKIPIQAVNGNLVVKAKAGTKTYINSDTAIHLTKENDGNEPLVLGATFQTAYSEHLNIDSTHDHIGNFGYNTSPPNQAADYVAIKSSPVDDSIMLSDLTFTEKGS